MKMTTMQAIDGQKQQSMIRKQPVKDHDLIDCCFYYMWVDDEIDYIYVPTIVFVPDTDEPNFNNV